MELKWVDSFDTFMEEIRKANCRKVHLSMANGPRFERIDEKHSIAHASTIDDGSIASPPQEPGD